MERNNIVSSVIQLINSHIKPTLHVNEETQFVADLGMSSLKLIGLFIKLDKLFAIDITNIDIEISDIRAVADLVDIIAANRPVNS